MTAIITPGVRRDLSLGVLLIGSTLTVLAGAVLTPVVQLLATERQLTATAAGLVVTIHGVSLALAAPLVGRLVDRHGVRRPLAAGLLLYGVAGGAGLVVDSYPALIATRLVFGVGAALVFTGTTLGLLDRHDGAARDRVLGWRSAAISLGGVVWPLVGGALGALSWQAPFAVYLLGIPLALLALRLPDDARPPVGPAAVSAPARVAPAPGVDPAAEVAGRWLPATRSDRRPLLAVYAVQGVATMLLYAVLVFLPVRMAELDVTSTVVVAAGAAGLSVAMTVAGLGYARLRARLALPRLLRSAGALWTVALLALAVVDAPALLLVAPALFGLGLGLAVPALTVLTAECAAPGRRGQATALLATAGFTGQVAAPLLFGPLQAASTAGTAFLAAAALAGLATVLLPGRRWSIG